MPTTSSKGYAHDLKDWFGFLQLHRLDWRRVQLEDLGGFLAWLRLPPRVRDGRVLVLACEDNLVRGASGVAVQNFNRMFGYDEAAGLL